MSTTFLTTRETADQLRLTTRTLRKWIDIFKDEIKPEYNKTGHIQLSPQSLEILKEINRKVKEERKTFKQIQVELKEQCPMPEKIAVAVNEEKVTSLKMHQTKNTKAKAENNPVKPPKIEVFTELMKEMFERVERLEDHMFSLFDALEGIEHKLDHMNKDSAKSQEMQNLFDDVRKKQDQLKIELRNVSFTQRLTTATHEQGFLPRRRQKKARFLGIF